MTYPEFKDFVDALTVIPDAVKDEIMQAASEYADGEVERAEDEFECDGSCGGVDPEDVLTPEAYNDLDECIRVFDDNPKDAKYLLSRALKEIPGAPKWLD